MFKKYSLVLVAFLCSVLSGFGQSIFTNPITGANPDTSNPYTIGQTVASNLTVSGIGRGAGVIGKNANDRYNANSWDTAEINLTAYFEFTLTPNSGYEIDFVSFVYIGQISGTGPTNFALRSSVDSFVTNVGVPIATGATISLTDGTYQNATTPITFRFYGWGASGGSGTFSINDFTFNGNVPSLSTNTVDYCNIQFPQSGNTTVGTLFNVYAQAYETGVTDPPFSQGANIAGWIGYSTSNTNPNTWINWVPATYNNVDSGNNDEYVANIGTLPTLPSGTYYYASRFQISIGPYSYGGYNIGGGNGFWDGINDVSGVLSVDTPDFVNLQFPGVGTINLGNAFAVYGQVYEQGVTLGAGQGAGIVAQVGYSTTNTNPNTWTNWIGATYNPSCTYNTCNSDQNDEYSANIGGAITIPGTYYYATRFKLNNGVWLYGGILSNGTAGNFWDGVTYITGVVNVIAPEINVEGNLGSFPDITSGDVTPTGTDNTLFAAQFIGSSQSKSYRIKNEGTANLTVSGVTIGGVNPSDFTVTITPSTTIAPSTFSLLEITFSPLAAGIRTAIVSISNNDSNENPFTFTVQGTGNCVASSTILLPSSGPVGTIITVTGTNYAVSTTAQISGISASVTYISLTVIEVTVPNGAATGNLVILNSVGCSSSNAFTVIDNQIGGCDGSSNLSDLFISEVTDATVGGVTFIEIYNGTGSTVLLGGYSLGIFSNGASAPSNSLTLNNISVANNATYIVAIGVTDSPTSSDTCSITGGNGQLANQTSGIGGINKKDNEHDMIRLLKSSGTIVVDEFGVYQDNDWMDTTIVTGDRGFNFRRLNTSILLPNPTFNISDWNIIDWIGAGAASCGTNDYSNIGVYDFSRGAPPSITLQPVPPLTSCDLTATLTIAGAEGYDTGNDTQGLTYQWFYNIPNTNTWEEILSNNTAYSGQQSPVLTILNTLNFDKYQYYAQVRENSVTCFKASNAISLKVEKTTWNGSSWAPTAPDINTIVVLSGDYDTANGGVETSFEACNLIVNAGIELRISDMANASATDTHVKVQNSIINSGEIYVDSKAALVQVEDDGIITLNSVAAKNTLSKFTHPLQFWYDYTYWSSPLEDVQIENALFTANANRRFLFNASQFNDILEEIGNTGTFIPGEDDIDDEGDDWVNQPIGSMMPGVGYAATHSNNGFISDTSYQYIFEGTLASGGAFNTGDINVNIYIDPTVYYNNWNLIGNPYPSAISAQKFFEDTESFLEGVIYLWSQSTNADSNASGNQAQNFSQNDYAMINYVGGVSAEGTASPSGSNIPNPFVPSGQGFFVIGKKAAVGSASTINPILFNNAMRVTGNNTQFFRTSETAESINKLWVNLTSDNGVFNQVLVGYLDSATDGYDGMHYDAPKNLSTGGKSILYMTIPNSDRKYAIQGKNSASLTLDEVIPLGFYTSINVPTIYKISIAQFEGDFFLNNPIYLKDNLLNTIHNLSAGDYMFSSEIGTFNNRFKIVFRDQALSVIENDILPNGLSIIELQNGQVKFSVGNNLKIKSIEILDMLGRKLYNLKGNSPSEIYELSNLSQAAYIAKVKLSNGQVITKRAVKRK